MEVDKNLVQILFLSSTIFSLNLLFSVEFKPVKKIMCFCTSGDFGQSVKSYSIKTVTVPVEGAWGTRRPRQTYKQPFSTPWIKLAIHRLRTCYIQGHFTLTLGGGGQAPGGMESRLSPQRNPPRP